MDKLVAMAASAICAGGLMISACAARAAPPMMAALVDERLSDAASLQPRFAATVGVFFELDGFTLTREARARLARQAAWLSPRSQLAVVIAGHCDPHEAGVDHAVRRADAVFDYLSAHGMAFIRIRKVSCDADRPLDTATSQAGSAGHRSAQIILIDLSSR